ncbi:MAG: tetratricopeptide repeat protein [Anaerolineales bacterium]|nr:tetratricopeptide repeat protein [Anaerolineales bacterium]
MPRRADVFQKAMNEGHSAAWDQEWGKAVSAYRKALQEFPDHPKALNSLGLALYQMGQFDDALQVYSSVAKLSPDDPVPMEKVAQLCERLGNLQDAVQASSNAADLFLAQRDTEKAIENWVRITNLNPDHAIAHSRLAQVHEKLGHLQQAVTEYLAVASLVQRSGNIEKTQELVTKALQIMPNSPDVNQAQILLKAGQLLPKPVRGKGGTGPIRMAQIKQLQEPKQAASGMDPIAEARQKALTQLAELLFEYSDENPSAQERRGLAAIMKGTGALSLQQAEQTKTVLYLGLAIDAQTKGQDAQAAEELDHALEAGFKHPSLYFDLGLLRSKGERIESALRFLQHAVKHKDYALGTRLLQGQIYFKKGQIKEAGLEYIEALKLADIMTANTDQADEVGQMYEPLIESYQSQNDDDVFRRLCDNVSALLMRADWREQLHKTREQMPKQEGNTPMPLADVILQAQSISVLESINRINQLARMGSLRSAMDEAYDAIQYAPTYLPLHALMGELLVKEGSTQDAIAKFSVVAHAYGVRGEVNQATKILRRVIQLAPMDLNARTRLIDQLVARGQMDDAVREYLELANIHYRLAELDLARKTYTTALRVIQQGNASHDWNVHIMQRMADIDMQRLDWKQAMRVFEQIRTIRPDDEVVRKQLIDLNLRMGLQQQALAELENFINYLESNNRTEHAILFLEDLLKEHEDQAMLKRALASQLHRAGRTEDAVAILDMLGESLIEAGNKKEALDVINQIVLMNPPNVNDYRQILMQLQAG